MDNPIILLAGTRVQSRSFPRKDRLDHSFHNCIDIFDAVSGYFTSVSDTPRNAGDGRHVAEEPDLRGE